MVRKRDESCGCSCILAPLTVLSSPLPVLTCGQVKRAGVLPRRQLIAEGGNLGDIVLGMPWRCCALTSSFSYIYSTPTRLRYYVSCFHPHVTTLERFISELSISAIVL